MGRPPCCDKTGVKKGPWTPEEDIQLVSYVQRHGPGSWRQVPTNTGLRRCSKSCRLRWTNYLRPGIRRGDFTHDEETMIIQLQALLGNKWSAIASYLPERTDNDIKNHWNTHLKNKLRKHNDHEHDHPLFLNSSYGINPSSSTSSSSSSSHISKGQWEKRLQTDVHMAKQALNDALSLDNKPFILLDKFHAPQTTSSYNASTQTTTYASSTDNIAKLLKGFMKNAPMISSKASSDSSTCKSTTGIDNSSQLGFESLLGFDQSFGSPNGSDLSQSNMSTKESKMEFIGGQLPFTMFENWLLDEAGGDVINQRKTDLTRFEFDQNPDYFHN